MGSKRAAWRFMAKMFVFLTVIQGWLGVPGNPAVSWAAGISEVMNQSRTEFLKKSVPGFKSATAIYPLNRRPVPMPKSAYVPPEIPQAYIPYEDPKSDSKDISAEKDKKAGMKRAALPEGKTTVYKYNANGWLLHEIGPDSLISYEYDNNGNMTKKTDGRHVTTYRYDYENRLVEVNDGINIITYGYDYDGIRTSKTVNGVKTRYLVDKNRDYPQVLEERDESGALLVSYAYGDDLISQNRGGEERHFHYDGQMSTRQLTDSDGNVTDTYTYDAFGNILDRTGTTENNYLYTGEQYDPNAGFYYLRARWMDPDIGRFITTDPWEGNIHDPVSLNKYVYANDNPIIFHDPSGEISIQFMMASLENWYLKNKNKMKNVKQFRKSAKKLCSISAMHSRKFLRSTERLEQYTHRYLSNLTSGTHFNAHHVLQDAIMDNLYPKYKKAMGFCVPLLGYTDIRHPHQRPTGGTPHSFASRVQRNGLYRGMSIEIVAETALRAAGCDDNDAQSIVEAAEKFSEIMEQAGWELR